MKTAIIIATFKRPDFLERLLISLSKCSFPPDVEIHVIENGPVSGAEETCRTHSVGGRVKYFYWHVAVKSLALNHVIHSGDADFLIFFDDDVKVPENIVSLYVDAAQRYGKGHFFGGPLIPDSDVECPTHLVPYLPRSAAGWSHGDYETEIKSADFEFFFGANWASFRSDLVRAGLFADELGITGEKNSPVGEETELQQRMVAAGMKAIYLPGAVIHHFVPRECYTVRWVWHRNFRLGVTDWITTYSAMKARRKIFGVPAWILRSAIEQKVWLLRSYLQLFSLARRTEIQIRYAYLAGMIHGARAEHMRSLLGRTK